MATEPTRPPGPWSVASLSANVLTSLLAAILIAIIGLLPVSSIPKVLEPVWKMLASPAPVWLLFTLGLFSWAVLSLKRKSAEMPKKRAPLVAPGDVRTVLASWVAAAPSTRLEKVISYAELDDDLRLPAGTSKRLLKELAASRRYLPKEEGEGTILLEYDPPRPTMRRSTGPF